MSSDFHNNMFFFKAGGLSGDGYQGLASPHTKHERFEGLTVYRAVEVSGFYLCSLHF